MASEMMTKGVIFDLQDTLLVGRAGRECTPRADLRPGLELLKAADVRLGVVTTSTEDDARQLLDAAGAAEFFTQAFVLGRDSQRPKKLMELGRERRPGLSGRLGFSQPVTKTFMQDAPVGEKPRSTRPIEYLLHAWALWPAEAVYVGDEILSDGDYAQRAGIKFAGIQPVSTGNESLVTFIEQSSLLK